jgi:N-glycosylase/DNA lyase
MIKLVLSDILNLEVLLPVIKKLIEKEEIITKALHYKYIKKNLYELEKHCCYFKKCFERYWSIFTFYLQFYNNMKFQPDELLIKLKNKRKVVLILNETGFQKQSSLYNDVYVFFKDLHKCLENESICLRLLFKDLDNIYMTTEKIIYRSELIKGN